MAPTRGDDWLGRFLPSKRKKCLLIDAFVLIVPIQVDHVHGH